jgi:hypothetical protein
VFVSLSLKEQVAQELETGLADGDAQVLRERVAREIPGALSSNGQRLSIHYWLEREAAGTGFATATLMAAELGEGARRLFEAELWYPGAALVRQLIECGYLLTLMSENRDEATAWMTSSHDEIVKKFMPRHMRQRAVRNFRPKEYEAHCDLGGHPNPVGRSLLSRHIERRELSMRGNWLDLAQHLADTWSGFVSGLPLYDPRMDRNDSLYSPARSPEHGQDIEHLLAEWYERDPIAVRSSPAPSIA